MKKLPGVRFFLTLALVFGGGLFFTLFPGSFSFKWLDYQANLPIAVVFVVIFILFAILLLLHNIALWIKELPSRSRRYVQKKKEKKFEDLVLDAFESIASQEFLEADLVTAVALKLQPDHPMGLLLKGQTSYLKGDLASAHTVFAKMTEIPAVSFFGLRGLAMMAMARSDVDHLESLLKKMYELRPNSPWVLKQLSQHYLMKAQQDTSTSMLPELPFYLHMSKKEADMHQGLLLWIKYINPENQNLETEIKLSLLKAIHEFMPHNPLVAFELAKMQYTHVGHIRALRTIYKTYKKAPHRLLGTVLIELTAPPTELDSYKKVVKLCAHNPLHHESCYLLGKYAFEANLWGQARYHLAPILAENPSREICELMAALEAAEYPEDEERVHLWKTKASHAAYWNWRCETCGREEFEFEPVCRGCGEFGSIKWTLSSMVPRIALSSPVARRGDFL